MVIFMHGCDLDYNYTAMRHWLWLCTYIMAITRDIGIDKHYEHKYAIHGCI